MNENADKYAKRAIKQDRINIQVQIKSRPMIKIFLGKLKHRQT